MAALDDLKQAVTDLNTSVSNEIAAVVAAIQAAQAGGDGSVSQVDAEGIVTQLQQTKATLDAETTALATPAPPPPTV